MAKGMRALLDTVMQALPQVNAASAGSHKRAIFGFIFYKLFDYLIIMNVFLGLDCPLKD